MKSNVANLLEKCAVIVNRDASPQSGGYAFMLRELKRHLEELAVRHKAGDAKAIEEFIDLYDLR